jgi:hypothetical protein
MLTRTAHGPKLVIRSPYPKFHREKSKNNTHQLLPDPKEPGHGVARTRERPGEGAGSPGDDVPVPRPVLVHLDTGGVPGPKGDGCRGVVEGVDEFLYCFGWVLQRAEYQY